MGYAQDAMVELHGDRMIDNDPPTLTQETDWQREMEARGRQIADAMGRYRGTEPLVEAVGRLADDYHEATRGRSAVLLEVGAELEQARATHRPMAGHHEGYAVILEELDELWDECKSNTHSKGLPKSQQAAARAVKRQRMRKEALQVAAMAVRFIEDVCDKD